ncbi:MAG TPA: hypothetical protein VGI80_00175 [Pyrinomonadaceae bacterium]
MGSEGKVSRVLAFLARYWLGTIFLIYAAPKVLGIQFRVLQSVYDTPLAQVSDFWLAWSFFGRSYEYQLVLAFAEISIASLVLFRRTQTIGALCSLPISINIVMVDYFFGVATGALFVASALVVAALYLVVPQFPRFKTFFWDEQPSSSSRRGVANLAYGALVFAGMMGVVILEKRYNPRPYEGAYTIERYSVNGVPQPVGPGQFGMGPTMYLEIRDLLVLSLNGKNTMGKYTIDPATRAFSWTPDPKAPDVVVNGTYETTGNEITLIGTNGTDSLEYILKRISSGT